MAVRPRLKEQFRPLRRGDGRVQLGLDPAVGIRTKRREQVPEIADTAEPFLIAEREDEANADHALAPRYHAT